jgi:outer membrane protein TolC
MRRIILAALVLATAAQGLRAQGTSSVPQPQLVHPPAPTGAPLVLTLADAMDRARHNDADLQASAAEAALAREDRVQARAAMLPALSYTTQYLGNQANGVNPNGRFVSADGVNMYRAWGVAHEELSADTFLRTTLRKARASEAVAQAKLDVAERGLDVTVTKNYYTLVTAERKYATAEQAMRQADRFLEATRQQEHLGQVARSDVVKAELTFRQQQQSYNDAALAMENARLALAVMLSPTLDENFTVVDDLGVAPPLPLFGEIAAMAERNNPELRAADQILRAAGQEVVAARNAFLPTFTIDAVYGIEANQFALHSRIVAQPELGVLPNLGYFVTLNLNVPVWDWGGLRSKLSQSKVRERQARVALNQTQRQAASDLYSMYNEALVSKSAVDNLQHTAELAAESLRLTNLRYTAGESTALEVVDAQSTFVQARNAIDDAQVRYRVALAELQTLTGSF